MGYRLDTYAVLISKLLQNFHIFLSLAFYVQGRDPELINPPLSLGEHM